MAFFPLNPANEDTHTLGGVVYRYDSATDSWTSEGTVSASIISGATGEAPVAAASALAIGSGSMAEHTGAIAIGSESSADTENQLVLGGDTAPNIINSVKIPGLAAPDSDAEQMIYVDHEGTWRLDAIPSGGSVDTDAIIAGDNITVSDTDGGVVVSSSLPIALSGHAGLGASVGTSDNSIAIGDGSFSFGSGTIAVGTSARIFPATNSSSVAVGTSAQANGSNAVSIGGTARSNTHCVAVGDNAQANVAFKEGSTALGSSSYVGGSYSTALGYDAYSDTDNQLVIGAQNADETISRIRTPGFTADSNIEGTPLISVDNEGNWNIVGGGDFVSTADTEGALTITKAGVVTAVNTSQRYSDTAQSWPAITRTIVPNLGSGSIGAISASTVYTRAYSNSGTISIDANSFVDDQFLASFFNFGQFSARWASATGLTGPNWSHDVELGPQALTPAFVNDNPIIAVASQPGVIYNYANVPTGTPRLFNSDRPLGTLAYRLDLINGTLTPIFLDFDTDGSAPDGSPQSIGVLNQAMHDVLAYEGEGNPIPLADDSETGVVRSVRTIGLDTDYLRTFVGDNAGGGVDTDSITAGTGITVTDTDGGVILSATGSDYFVTNGNGAATNVIGTDGIGIGEDTSIGLNAGHSNAIGIGSAVGVTVQEGIAIGRQADARGLSSSIGAIAIGSQAGAVHSSIALGYDADAGSASGTTLNNIAVGREAKAGTDSTTPSNNIAVGYQARAGDAANLDNSIALGNDAVTTSSNQLVIGSTTASRSITSIVTPGFIGAPGQFISVDSDGDWSSSTPVSSAVPSSSTDLGMPGQIAYDATHLYICVGINTWRRVAHATW